MQKYSKLIIYITFIVIIIFLIKYKLQIQHYIITQLFSLFAPKNKNIKYKILSDNLFFKKFDIENNLQTPFSEENNCKINIYNYNDIKNIFNNSFFRKITNNYTQPVLLKKIFTNELDNYTYDKLIQQYGNISIEAIKLTSDDLIGLKMTFTQYINMINNGEKYYLTVNNSIANKLNNSNFVDFYKKIFDNVGFSNIFIGNKDSFTRLHCEIAASCAIQLNGKKKWFLINPKLSHYLHPIPDKNKIFYASLYGFHNKIKTVWNLPRCEIVCEKGDFLYVPPWWWHETENITNESIMYSARPPLFMTPYYTNLEYTLLTPFVSIGFSKYIYPILTYLNIIDSSDDTVIESLQQIKYRIPIEFKKYFEQ